MGITVVQVQLQHFIKTYLHYGATYLWKINQNIAIRIWCTYTASAKAKYKECIALHIGNIYQRYTEAQHTHMVERE